MKLSPPTNLVFFISTVLALLGILALYVTIPVVSGNEFWFEFSAFALLWIGSFFKGI